LNALMETEAGKEWLKSGVRIDPVTGGFLVRLFDNGKEVWVPVTQVLVGGDSTVDESGNPINGSGVSYAALYEAAMRIYFGAGALDGNNAQAAASAVGNQSTFFGGSGLTDGTLPGMTVLGGSKGGDPTIANTPESFTSKNGVVEKGSGYLIIKDAKKDAEGPNKTIKLVPRHAYEVVDTKNGMVGLRNPWGKGNDVDGPADNADGVFYISGAEFRKAFPDVSISW
jgi:hypothetical protein